MEFCDMKLTKKYAIENIEDKFSDFENEVDNIYITISDLLGKVGN